MKMIPEIKWTKCYMDIDEFMKFVQDQEFWGSYLILEELKYECEKEYEYCINRIVPENGHWCIDNDSWEGQEHYKVVAYMLEYDAECELEKYFKTLTRKQIEEVN